jgi:hypothetical protein
MIKPALFAAITLPLLAAPLATYAAERCVSGPGAISCERSVPRHTTTIIRERSMPRHTTTIIRHGPRFVPGPGFGSSAPSVTIKKKVHRDFDND